MGGPAINYKKLDKLLKTTLSTKEIAKRCPCNAATVNLRARENGEPRVKTGRPRKPSEPREKSIDYLAALRTGFPTDKRQNEGLSSYVQGVGK